jgi:hypothetical protein
VVGRRVAEILLGAPRPNGLAVLEPPVQGGIKIDVNQGNLIEMQLHLSDEECAAHARHLCDEMPKA